VCWVTLSSGHFVKFHFVNPFQNLICNLYFWLSVIWQIDAWFDCPGIVAIGLWVQIGPTVPGDVNSASFGGVGCSVSPVAAIFERMVVEKASIEEATRRERIVVPVAEWKSGKWISSKRIDPERIGPAVNVI